MILSLRERFDRAGILLSGLCVVHCILGLILVSALGVGGSFLLSPEIHRYGLAAAVAIGALTLGLGAIHHGKAGPLIAGVLGLCLMAAALLTGHGVSEAVLTIAGVALVAGAHLANLRHAH